MNQCNVLFVISLYAHFGRQPKPISINNKSNCKPKVISARELCLQCNLWTSSHHGAPRSTVPFWPLAIRLSRRRHFHRAFAFAIAIAIAFGNAISYCSSKNDCTQLCFMALRRYGSKILLAVVLAATERAERQRPNNLLTRTQTRSHSHSDYDFGPGHSGWRCILMQA